MPLSRGEHQILTGRGRATGCTELHFRLQFKARGKSMQKPRCRGLRESEEMPAGSVDRGAQPHLRRPSASILRTIGSALPSANSLARSRSSRADRRRYSLAQHQQADRADAGNGQEGIFRLGPTDKPKRRLSVRSRDPRSTARTGGSAPIPDVRSNRARVRVSVVCRAKASPSLRRRSTIGTFSRLRKSHHLRALKVDSSPR
jgi:hypothetical protein